MPKGTIFWYYDEKIWVEGDEEDTKVVVYFDPQLLVQEAMKDITDWVEDQKWLTNKATNPKAAIEWIIKNCTDHETRWPDEP